VSKIGGKWEDVFNFTQNQEDNMSRFKGDHYCKVDSKGRILFPAKLKKQSLPESGEAFVGKLSAFEKSLLLYTQSAWDLLADKTLSRLNPYNAKHDQFKRDFFRDVVDLDFDSSGRILLPRRFLEILQLVPGEGGDVVLAGQGDRIELMSQSQYQATELTSEERKSLSQDVMGEFTWDDGH
jgi:MraZ protein